MPVVVSMLNPTPAGRRPASVHAGQPDAHHRRCAGSARPGRSSTYIMYRAMNRSIINVILGGFRRRGRRGDWPPRSERPVQSSGSADDAAFLMKAGQHSMSSCRVMAWRSPGPSMRAELAEHLGIAVDGPVRDSSSSGPHAGTHERAAGGGQGAL